MHIFTYFGFRESICIFCAYLKIYVHIFKISSKTGKNKNLHGKPAFSPPNSLLRYRGKGGYCQWFSFFFLLKGIGSAEKTLKTTLFLAFYMHIILSLFINFHKY